MRIEHNAPVGRLTTFGVAARARTLVGWSDPGDLAALEPGDAPVKVIGGGSNLLFTDDFDGLLLLREGTPQILRGNNHVWEIDAHAVLDDICAAAARANLRGLENLSGIPGTLGGALVQNAGAYGAETGTLLIDMRLFDLKERTELTVDRQWMRFGYRSSRLKEENGRYVILSARLQLLEASAPANIAYGNLQQALEGRDPTPENVRRAVLETRAAKLPDPKEVGSAGSFFRNPEISADLLQPEMPRYDLGNGLFKVPAAWLIDQCGLKGASRGGASVWPQQPLVIVNAHGTATAADILALENHIVNTVSERFNITLIPEVEHL